MFYKDGWTWKSGVKMWLSDRKAVREEMLKESQIKDKLFPVNWNNPPRRNKVEAHRTQGSQETYKSQES